ncbi:MAG: hypothetical protein ACO4AI_14270 [Prochlorothrix sp.]|nr:hypothetical protein [Prochlorothrix sp.]
MLPPQTCPYCSHRLLRHVSAKGLYWRCSHCREELTSLSPTLESHLESQFQASKSLLTTAQLLEEPLLEAVS